MTVQDWNQSEEKNQLIAFVAAVDIAEKGLPPTSDAHPASHQKQTSLLNPSNQPKFPSSWLLQGILANSWKCTQGSFLFSVFA